MPYSIVFGRQERLWPLSDFSHNPGLYCVLINQLDLLFCNDACCGVFSSESLRDFSFLIISLPSRVLRTQFTFFFFFQEHLITFSQLQPKNWHLAVIYKFRTLFCSEKYMLVLISATLEYFM